MTKIAKDIDQAMIKASKIKLMIFDVDGVLTDGSLFYSENGEAIKVFNVLDGYGIKQLQKNRIITAVISGRSSKALDRRLAELNLDYVFTDNGDDKSQAFFSLLQQAKIKPNECGMMGDDIPDIDIMIKCGFSAAPKNSVAQVLDQVDWISKKIGGHGAVREVCDLIINQKVNKI